MKKAPTEIIPKDEAEKIIGKAKNQNQHYNIKKEALGPNAKRGR